MSITEVKVPDIGDFESVEIIEVICKKGDTVSVEDPLISVESDKATMDVPSPIAGVIREIKVKVGEKVSAGSLILKMETTYVSTENEEEINIKTKNAEFKEWKWIDVNQLINVVVSFKLNVYKSIVKELNILLN